MTGPMVALGKALSKYNLGQIGKKDKSLEKTLEINGMTRLFKLQWLFHPKF